MLSSFLWKHILNVPAHCTLICTILRTTSPSVTSMTFLFNQFQISSLKKHFAFVLHNSKNHCFVPEVQIMIIQNRTAWEGHEIKSAHGWIKATVYMQALKYQLNQSTSLFGIKTATVRDYYQARINRSEAHRARKHGPTSPTPPPKFQGYKQKYKLYPNSLLSWERACARVPFDAFFIYLGMHENDMDLIACCLIVLNLKF